MLSREAAASIAREAILARGLGTGVRHVYRLSELPFRRPMLYGPDLTHCWIAYAERPVRGLGPSTVLILDEVTGEVLYAGSANDEG